jgi:ferritin-like metal-binding protein YciE
MIKAATHPKLKQGFTKHERQTRQHVKRLDRIFRQLDERATGKKCVGMEGIIKEATEAIKEHRSDKEVLDAALITTAQHVEHYEMAGYGTVRTWARVLGLEDHSGLLQQTLDEEKATDENLTMLAESSINLEAAEPDADDDEEDEGGEE